MLAQEWTLSVKDFGPIKSADVTTAPLTVFAGKNNTGKSHLASLLWGLMQPPIVAGFALTCTNHDIYRIISQLKDEFRCNGIDIKQVLLAVNSCFSEKPLEFVRRLFQVEPEGVAPIIHLSGKYIRKAAEDDVLPLDYPAHLPRSSPVFLLLGDFLGNIFFPSYAYIPAGRTGLVLSFRSYISGFILSGERKQVRFPLPVSDFLVNLIKMPVNGGSFDDIASRLEADIINGTISVAMKNELPEISLVTRHKPVPLHIASSLVTELAPFLVLLRAGSLDNGFIFEEPEAHLHLDAQRALARALARLLNRGVPMILTTHSDTFLQQLNIQMWLHGHPKRDKLMQELGYEEEELIDPAMARGYHFEPQPDGTIVKEMEKRPQGLVVPSMNQTIADMRKEIIALQREQG